MFKYLKMIGMLKDVRAEVKAQGTIKNILLSRKFWGVLWILGAYYLDQFFGVKIDQHTQEMITNSIVVGASAAMVLFGALMQIVSYYKTIMGLIKKK
jgi:hypothetical protein